MSQNDDASYYAGHLFSCRHDAYSVVVAALSGAHAREAFQDWLSRTHGVSVRPEAIRWPKSTRSIGDRPLLIAR